MKLDAMALMPDPATAAGDAVAAQAAGFDGWFTAETGHDPFVIATLAAAATDRVEVGTAIAVAFARSPMDVAYSANDLQVLSDGRFVLGLGSQIQAHITKRFSMPWSKPAARMREYVQALRAIWASWLDGERLDFRGDFYEHRIMTPFFAGTRHDYGPPPVVLAAVGPLMTQVAGEVADGVLCHAFTTRDYLDAVTLPAVRAGAEKAGRPVEDVDVTLGVFVVTGRDDRQRAAVEQAVKAQLSFYGSTPAYRPVLDQHGWGDLQVELNTLSKQGRWDEMAGLIDDEVLEAFALVVDDPDEVGPAVTERFGDVVARLSLYPTWEPDQQALDALRSHLGR